MNEDDIVVEVELPDTSGEAAQQQAPATQDGQQTRRPRVDDEGLSERVQKRIAKEVAKSARFRSAAIQEAETRARLERQVAELEGRLANATEVGTSWAESSAQQKIEHAKAEIQAAMELGDATRLAAAQQQLTRATLVQDQIAQSKPQAPQQRQQAPQQAPQMPPRRQAWLAENEWFASDAPMRNAAIGYHHIAVGKGLKPDTDEYFAEIDRRMRGEFPDQFDEDGDEPAPQQQRPERRPSASGVAPVNRTAAAQQPPPGKVKLTAEQVSIAQSLGLSAEMYARHLVALKNKGKLS